MELIKVFQQLQDNEDFINEFEGLVLDFTDRTMYPSNLKQHIGVEIECVGSLDRIQLMNLLLVNNLFDKVSIGDDDSISSFPYDHSYELKVLDTVENIYTTIQLLCRILNKNDFNVNETCGLHIHLDCRSKTRSQTQLIFKNFCLAQELLFKITQPEEERLEYCDYQHEYNIDKLTCYRRKAIHYNQHYGTIEVRIHNGSLDSNEINNWIRFLLMIFNKRKESSTQKLNRTSSYHKSIHPYIKEKLSG